MSSFFSSADFSQYPAHMKELIIVHTSSLVQYDEEYEEGFYIGISLFEIPEHFSMKRICIDIRTLFINSGFVPEDIHPDFVSIKAKVLKA